MQNRSLLATKVEKIEANEEISQIKLEKVAVERELMLLTDKTFIEVPCQTDSHPEIPYCVTQPLTPYFRKPNVLEISCISPLQLLTKPENALLVQTRLRLYR